MLFLDADDTYPGADVLAGLDADLAVACDPDVLLFGYEEWRPCGLSRRISVDWGAARDGPCSLSAAERARVLGAPWVCWNKVYRREFVVAAGLRFPPGLYEDFAWSIPALLAAGRVAVSGAVCAIGVARAGSLSRWGESTADRGGSSGSSRSWRRIPSMTAPRFGKSSPPVRVSSCAGRSR